MKTRNPLLPNFPPLLGGRKAPSALRIMQEHVDERQRRSLSGLATLFEPWIPAALLAPPKSGPNSRERLFPLPLIFWAFLLQVLSPKTSCREILRKMQAAFIQQKGPSPSQSTSAYCTARKRLAIETLHHIHGNTAEVIERNTPLDHLWQGRRVKLIDGTGLSMPDTPSNQRAFPQPSRQKRGCGFPVAHLVGCFSLASGALLHWAEGTLRIQETRLFRRLLDFFNPGDIALADRGFCSYFNIATLLGRGTDSVMRLHHARPHDMRKGKKLGHRDRLVRWENPKRPPIGCSADEWSKLPASLCIRHIFVSVEIPGFRTRSFIVVTTLTDPIAYPASQFAALYMRRWHVELFFRHIKTTLGMDVLRCKSAEMVRKEIAMHAIAYNLIRGLMQRAAVRFHAPLERISFKGAIDSLRQWQHLFAEVDGRPRLYQKRIQEFLETLANDLVPCRPHRTEPRVRKRRPKAFPLMTKPRQEYHAAYAA